MSEPDRHLNNLTLLRFVSGELGGPEAALATRHIGQCEACLTLLGQMGQLDAELAVLVGGPTVFGPEGPRLAPDDPFRKRPDCAALGHGPGASVIARQFSDEVLAWLAGRADGRPTEPEIPGARLEFAYAALARSGDELGLATVELLESGRRLALGRGREALVLARRSGATFQEHGLADRVARARAAEGRALDALGRAEEALAVLERSLETFEGLALRGEAAAVLAETAACLFRLGRIEEARRQYARALRHLSKGPDAELSAAVRAGLAEVLAAASAGRRSPSF